MWKAARHLPARNSVVPNCYFPSPFSGLFNNASVRNFTHVSEAPGYSSSIWADFTIFKGKAALSVSPFMPKFTRHDSGAIRRDRNGGVRLTFMPSIGLQKYDWERRQVFALNPTEAGCLISLNDRESCDFVHDPKMKSSFEGQVKKNLSIKPIASDGGGYFINLTVNDNIKKTSDYFSVPVSKAEFGVIRTSFCFIMPYIMGWDRIVNGQYTTTPEQIQSQDRFVKRQYTTTPEPLQSRESFVPRGPDAEWNK